MRCVLTIESRWIPEAVAALDAHFGDIWRWEVRDGVQGLEIIGVIDVGGLRARAHRAGRAG